MAKTDQQVFPEKEVNVESKALLVSRDLLELLVRILLTHFLYTNIELNILLFRVAWSKWRAGLLNRVCHSPIEKIFKFFICQGPNGEPGVPGIMRDIFILSTRKITQYYLFLGNSGPPGEQGLSTFV